MTTTTPTTPHRPAWAGTPADPLPWAQICSRRLLKLSESLVDELAKPTAHSIGLRYLQRLGLQLDLLYDQLAVIMRELNEDEWEDNP